MCNKEVTRFHPKSHILPEWGYKALYDETHRLAAMDLNNETDKAEQKGRYGTYWCSSCEGDSSKYDDYASVLLAGRKPHTIERIVRKTQKTGTVFREGKSKDVVYEYWEGIDVNLFHKFVIVCAIRGELAVRVHARPKLTNSQLKKLINSYYEDRPNTESLPLQMFEMKHDGLLEKAVVLPFLNNKPPNHEPFVEFHLHGYLFQLFLEPLKTKALEVTLLQADGSIYVTSIPHLETGTIKKQLPKMARIIAKSKFKPK
jgi:hypothetical protein